MNILWVNIFLIWIFPSEDSHSLLGLVFHIAAMTIGKQGLKPWSLCCKLYSPTGGWVARLRRYLPTTFLFVAYYSNVICVYKKKIFACGSGCPHLLPAASDHLDTDNSRQHQFRWSIARYQTPDTNNQHCAGEIKQSSRFSLINLLHFSCFLNRSV